MSDQPVKSTDDIADDIEKSVTRGLNDMLILLSNMNTVNGHRKLSERVKCMKKSATALNTLTEHMCSDPAYNDLSFDEVINAMLHYVLTAHSILRSKNKEYDEMSKQASQTVGSILMGLANGSLSYDDDTCDECDSGECDCERGKDDYKRDHGYRDPGIC